MKHEAIVLCFLTLTEEHLQLDEATHKIVKVYGVLSVSVTADNGLHHSAVDLETCERRGGPACHHFVCRGVSCTCIISKGGII